MRGITVESWLNDLSRGLFRQFILSQLFELTMKDIALVNRSIMIIMPIFGCLASMVSGYFIVYFTMMDEYIQKYHNYTPEETDFYFTIMMAALPVGAFIGSFGYNRFIDIQGENSAMKTMDVVAVIAALMQTVSIYFPVVIVSRFLMGIYCAITTGLIPSWIISMSPSFTSGIFGTFNQVAIATGMATAYCMGQFLQDHPLGEEIKVRIYIGIPILTSIVHFIGLQYFGFDNIERLIANRDHNEVIRFMKTVYGKNWKKFQKQVRNFKILPIQIPQIKQAQEEQEESKVQSKQAQEEQTQQKSIVKIDWQKIKKRMSKIKTSFRNCEITAIGIMLAVANQASGIIAILEYAKQLFVKIQDTAIEADVTLLLFGFFQVVVTLISGFFINHFGRRPMMMIGQTIIVVSLLACVLATMLVDKHEIITTAILFVYILGYSISIGPLFMMYAVETLSNIQLVIQIYWGLMILLTLTTDILIETIGLPIMFGIFFICSLLSLKFFHRRMVETKDVPKKEIKSLLEKNEFIWESSEYIFSQSIKTETQVQKTLGTI